MTPPDLAFAARHSCDSPEWYTPSPFVEAARAVMGGIDLDPASHEEANRIVKAKRFYTVEDNGLTQPWRGRVFLNPPGAKDDAGDRLVPQFWKRLVSDFVTGDVEQAIWIGFSLEQFQTLQIFDVSPLDFSLCIPSKRIAFVENEAKKAERFARLKARGKVPTERSSPSHAGYICYLGRNLSKFVTEFGPFGAVRTR
jgi:hypothetical protein